MRDLATGHRGLVRKRTFVLFILLVVVYLAVAGRLLYVQVINNEHYLKWGASISQRQIPLPAVRGTIYDRDKRVLAVSIESASIFARRKELKDIKFASRKLAETLGEDAKTIETKLQSERDEIWIVKRVDPRIGRRINQGYKTAVRKKVGKGYRDVEKQLKLPGIGVVYEAKRVYPAGVAASQVLGFVNSDNVGAEGLERVENKELCGRDGSLEADVDPRRRVVPEAMRTLKQPVNGKDVVLTIDLTIQQIADEALRKMAETYTPESACAVVLDSRTSEVLAVANYPAFDPNTASRNNPALWRNRAVADLYEPGSTLKMVTVAAAVNEGISPRSIVTHCARIESITGGRIRCSVHPPYMSGHGPVDMYKIIQHSCNIGSAHLAFRLGSKKLYEYEKAFGLIDRTRAGFGCEAAGYMIPPEKWRPMKLANIGFGQGIAVTPLQMAAAYATIANGGVYNEPQIVKEIRDSKGEMVKRASDVKPRQVISREAANEVTKMLMLCAEEGTGKPAQIKDRTVAGKTGSAQIAKPKGGYEPGEFIASFIGFAPATKPRLVIAVVVTRPRGSHWGATVAAPVFKEIGEQSLWYLRVPPDAPEKPKSVPKPGGTAKELV